MKLSTDQAAMQVALEEANCAYQEGEIPVGAVITDNTGTILVRTHNRCEQLHDATAHAEILAIREAGALLHNWRLSQLTLYVTLEPCPMCAGALLMSRVKRLVYGAADWRAGGCESVFNIVTHPWLNHQLEVRGGVLEDECLTLLKHFFAERRELKAPR